jgi:NTE family protein
MVEALKQAIVFGVLPLIVIQCVIGLWLWKLASDGRKVRRDTARWRARLSLVLEPRETRRRANTRSDSAAGDLSDDILERLNALEAVAAQRSPRPPKLGIALSGGGGKGAYQVGVLRVLRAAGVSPDVIAGTSVGAINATLLCLDEIEVAADFWNTISFWQIARVTLANLAAFPLLLFAVITAGASDDIDGPTRRMILTRYYVLLLLLNVFGVLFWGWPLVGVVTDVVGCAAVVTLGYLADPLVGLLGLALLSNAPRAAKIQTAAPPDRLRAAGTPLYVTVATRRPIIDPNHPHWIDKPQRILRGRRPYVPEYRCLRDESDVDVQRLVLQSAAIPFGVFPLRRIGRSGYVDGGVADNVPIQPLIDAGCTTILVIHLNPNGDCNGWRLTNAEDLRAHLGQLRELQRLAALRRQHTVADLTHQARLRTASPELRELEDRLHVMLDYTHTNPTFVHIVPSVWLGNFLTGTMNFRAKKARRLITLGEDDAWTVLARSPELAALDAC